MQVPSKEVSTLDKMKIIAVNDLRISPKIKEARINIEEAILGMSKEATDKNTSIDSKTKIVNSFIRYKQMLSQDFLALIQAIEDLPPEKIDLLEGVLDGIRLGNAKRGGKKTKLDKNAAFK